jgi:hypothetical protein
MFERLARSFELAKSSWRVLRTDKKLVLFPIISAIATLAVLLAFAGPLIGLQLANVIDLDPANNNGQVPIWVYPVVFAFYFCTYFVIIFCNSALVSCALMRFNGQEPTLGDGFRAAGARLPQIVAWSLLSATVGLILYVIENVHEKVGEIISFVLGTAWTIMTYFVVPVLVVEKLGPFAAIGRSVSLLKKTWGEALAGGIGLGLFKLLILLPGFLLLIGGIALGVAMNSLPVGLGIGLLGVVWLLLGSAACAALDTIFLTALYQYAAFDKVPDGFSRESIEGAFEKKKAS